MAIIAREILDATPAKSNAMTRLVLVVAAAIYNDQKRLLCAQRPAGKRLAGLWELPGGKVEPNETPEAALQRELAEELAIAVQINDLQPLTFASFAYENFHLLMPVFALPIGGQRPKGNEGQAIEWVTSAQIGRLPMPPADLALIPHLQGLLARV